MINKLICKIFGHKDIRVIVETVYTDKNTFAYYSEDTSAPEGFQNGELVYVERKNRCSRCFEVIK